MQCVQGRNNILDGETDGNFAELATLTFLPPSHTSADANINDADNSHILRGGLYFSRYVQH
jgi:hypothetical protein